jgi:hypothetical protein
MRFLRKCWEHHPLLVVALLVTAIFAVNFASSGGLDPPEDKGDDLNILYSGYYFKLAFVEHDFSSIDWKSYDAVDHAPLHKYFYGGIAYLFGFAPSSIASKLQLVYTDLDSSMSDSDRAAYRGALAARVPKAAMIACRVATTLVYALDAILIFLIARRVFSTLAGGVAALSFSLSPTAREQATLLSVDSLAILFTLLATLLLLRWDRLRRGNARLVGTPLALGAILGLAFITKISAVFIMLAAVLVLALLPICDARSHPDQTSVGRAARFVAIQLLLVTAAAVAVALALDPSLHHDPIGFIISMFQHRANRMGPQGNFGYEFVSRPNIIVAIPLFLRALFFSRAIDPLQQFCGIPFLLLFTVFGCFVFNKVTRGGPAGNARDGGPRIVLLTMIIVLCGTAATYRVPWDRYVLGSLSFVVMLFGHGVCHALALLRGTGDSNARRDVGRALVVATVVGIVVVNGFTNTSARKDINVVCKFYTAFFLHEDDPQWVEAEQRLRADPEKGQTAVRMRELMGKYFEVDLQQWRRQFPEIHTAVDFRRRIWPQVE